MTTERWIEENDAEMIGRIVWGDGDEDYVDVWRASGRVGDAVEGVLLGQTNADPLTEDEMLEHWGEQLRMMERDHAAGEGAWSYNGRDGQPAERVA